jgi:hypothetical protein
MNRRLVLFDQNEINGAMLFGNGLSTDVHPIQAFFNLDKEQTIQALGLGDSDAVMLVGGNAFKWLREFIHFGVRGENYSDCARLYRLSLEGGSFAKCCSELPSKKDIAEFMDPNFTTHVDLSWFKYKCIGDFDGAIRFLDWLDSLPDNAEFGFDYETSGMPNLKTGFFVSGCSIVTNQGWIGAYLSWTDLRHTCTPDQYNYFKTRLGDFLEKRQEHIWTYNMTFEFQVTKRELNRDLTNLADSSVFNIMEGLNYKKLSLKFSGQYFLKVDQWDSEFDRISDLIDSMLFEEVGKLKKDKHKVLKVTLENYKDTPEWQELTQRYPDDIKEMENLMVEYWPNSQFMAISLRLIGKYCCLDSLVTLMIAEQERQKYSKIAIDTFLDNLRLACRLHSCGINKDEPLREKYAQYSLKMMDWGITYCAESRCMLKMRKHAPKAAPIKKYSSLAVQLLNENAFFNGDTMEIAKYLLSGNIDNMDTNELGLDTGSIMLKYGEQFALDLETIVRAGMVDAGMIKTDRKGNTYIKEKLGEKDISRKKKLIEYVGNELYSYLGINKLSLGNKHIELEKYLYYERAYKELMKVSQNQLNSIDNIPNSIYAFNQKMSTLDYANYVNENFFYCTSPVANDEIIEDMMEIYKTHLVFITALSECIQQLDGQDKFFEKRGITTVEDGYLDFMYYWEAVCNGTDPEQTPYCSKMYQEAIRFYNNPKDDAIKELWGIDGFTVLERFFGYISNKDSINSYCTPFSEQDLDNDFYFLRKYFVHLALFKKYNKIYTTYVSKEGMFGQTDRWVIDDPESHIILRDADPDEPGASLRMNLHFSCMEKSSKRWSSPVHTIPSHLDCKSIIKAYPGCLLSYFDISSAEVRAMAAMSGCKELQEKFENRIDVYNYTAQLYVGKENWEKLSKKEKKELRGKFKTVTLGLMYGLGKQSLAARLFCTVEEAQKLIDVFYTAYPRVKDYIKEQGDYVLNHDGYVNTLFKDKLQPIEWKYYLEAPTQREKKNQEARLRRLGVNLPIRNCGLLE